METRLDQLRQQRQGLSDQVTALIAERDKSESKTFSEEQRATFDKLEQDIDALTRQIEEEAKVEARKMREIEARAFATAPQQRFNKDEREASQKFSFARALNQMAERGHVYEGAEVEVHQEAVKEARDAGVAITGLGLPSTMVRLQGMKKRAMSVTGDAEDGSYFVPTELDGIIPILQPKLTVLDLGARLMTGLVGNQDMVGWNARTSAAWAAETGAASEGTPDTRKFTLTPKRLTRTSKISRRLLIQSPWNVENEVRSQLEFEVAAALDAGAINGSGVSNQPTGILNFANRGAVAIDTNGGAPTRQHLIELIREIETENAPMDSLAFLSNPLVKAKLMNTLLDAGSGKFIKEAGEGLLGYRDEYSTQVPSNLTKAAGSNLSAIIFGNWRSLIVAQWSGVDIIVDPYTSKGSAELEMTVHGWYDINAYHEQAFAAVVDAVTTL